MNYYTEASALGGLNVLESLVDRTLLLPLLWHLDDPMSNAVNPALRASVASVAAANAITPDPAADAMEPRPGSER